MCTLLKSARYAPPVDRNSLRIENKEPDRVWVIFDWDEQGFKNFLSDPEVPAIIKEAGHVGKPQPATFGGLYGA
jgi:hypothetical protein